jgi:H+/Cl- antiporter ClcA
VGREGVGLIMSGALTDGLLSSRPDEEKRSIWLQSALSAGFTGMFGTPWAALLFIYEVNDFKDFKNLWRLASISLSIVFNLLTGHFLETPHMEFPLFQEVSWQGLILLLLAVPLVSYSFYYSYHWLHELLKKLGPLQLPLGSLLVAMLIYFLGTRYAGLGADVIAEAILGNALPWDWVMKLLLTTLCLAAGLKGGEVTPLFFIGATLGAYLGTHTADPELSKIGLVAVLGSLTQAPIAAAILATELFGIKILPWAILVTWIGKKSLGKRHLYRI